MRFANYRSDHIRILPVVLLLVLLAISSLSAGEPAVPSTPAPTDRSKSDVDAHIAMLIKQLGATRYATREKAELELEQLGLRAFDALNKAQASDDMEIALRARYLVRSMRIHWSQDEDSIAVKQILNDYGQNSEQRRRIRLQQLAALPRRESLIPLCRLAKYEQSPRLSRRAALLIIEAKLPKDHAARHKLAQQILAQVGSSKRAAAQWLRLYAAWLQGKHEVLAQWQPIIAHEIDLLAHAEDNNNRMVVRDLLWWYADQLESAGNSEQANKALRQSIELLDNSMAELLATVDRFRAKKSWEFVAQIAHRFPAAFRRSPLLMYRLADAQMHMGQQDAAEKTAQLAQKAVPNEPREHLMAAANLQHDGLFEWAEKEYRSVIKKFDEQPMEAATAVFLLSEMLHDRGLDRQAGNVLEHLVSAMKSDQDARKQIEANLARPIGSVESRMYFFFACDANDHGDTKKQRELLSKAIGCDPTDADVLIAMYRLPGADAKWKSETRQRIQQTAAHFKADIAKYNKMLRSPQPDQRILAKTPLATACNQYAWLIANTEGDFAEAIRMSQRSLVLRPDTAGYLDTLGHCYFANGDYAKAVEAQTKAAMFEPHSPQILAKLELFKKTQAEHSKSSSKNEAK